MSVMSTTVMTILQLIILLLNLDVINCEEYYIKPTASDTCRASPCLTLSQFSANATSYIGSGNTTLLFQSGIHLLNSTLAILNTQNFSMHPLSVTSNITILCERSAAFDFDNSERIFVRSFEFVSCSRYTVLHVWTFVLEKSIFYGNKQSNRTSLIEVSASKAYILQNTFTGAQGVRVLTLNSGSFAEIAYCRFQNNTRGVIDLYNAGIVIEHSLFYNNSIENELEVGAAIYALSSRVIIHESNFYYNSASMLNTGAIHAVQHSTLSIHRCTFHKNKAHNMAGAISVWIRSEAVINATVFSGNVAKRGGALVVYKEAKVIIEDCLFVNNKAETGGIIYAYKNSTLTMSNTKIDDNKASCAVVFVLGSTALFSNDTMYSNNAGSLLVFNSKLNIFGNSTFINNRYTSSMPTVATDILLHINEGGAVTALQSEVVIDGSCTLMKNQANIGGAFYAIQSKVHLLGELNVSSNVAKESGGGLYLSQSELTCDRYSRINLVGNSAKGNGGGIYAISSFISIDFSLHAWLTSSSVFYEYLGSLVHFTGNQAAKGGGIYLAEEAKIYILKNEEYPISAHHSGTIRPMYVLTFRLNSAMYGGAVYVSDKTNFGTCSSSSFEDHSASNECFLQTLALHLKTYSELNIISTKFERNIATVSGSTLFGGLLDRCTASSFAEVFYKFYTTSQADSISGLSYLQNISTIQDGLDSISSHPVRLCFCRDEQPDCFYKPHRVKVMKGENFTLSLVAVDQLNKTISNSSIHSYLSSYEGTLGTDQSLQSSHEGCTQLTFAAFSLQKYEELVMYPEGPCGNVKMSQLKQEIEFLPCSCPIGFEEDASEKSTCKCKCDSRLPPYITECNASTGMLIRKGDFWIDYVNDSDGFVVYPHCPRDYCQPSSLSVGINLNIPNGSDAQCTHSRSGVLCGSCKPGLSLSLDGKNCVTCKQNWPLNFLAIIIAAILAGLLLVTFIMLLNLTVAVGALNGILFYANIVNINKDILFPFPKPNYVTVFISWLNLDIGFDTCFFDGMDAYSKTWLQLVFPTYLIFLVVMVIILGERSRRFAHLIGKKDPVATLATLILLSYDKLFHTTIQVFSFVVLDYPNGSQEVLWLIDGNVKYFRGKHIPLFFAAFFIFIICILYTVLLFSWQWLLRCPNKKCFAWIRNQKLHLFLKSYHTPYSIKRRYWTGLLLIVRVALSISSAVNMSNDPGLNLLLFGMVMIFLIVFSGRFSPVYENPINEFIEVTVYVNMVCFFAFSVYFLQAGKHQSIAAYISGTVAIIQLLVVIFHHLYAHFLSKQKIIIKLRKVFSQRIDDELANFPPQMWNNDARNPPESILPSLDHHRVNYSSIDSNDGNNFEENNSYSVNTYGCYYSQMETEVLPNETNENSPLISTSSSNSSY